MLQLLINDDMFHFMVMFIYNYLMKDLQLISFLMMAFLIKVVLILHYYFIIFVILM